MKAEEIVQSQHRQTVLLRAAFLLFLASVVILATTSLFFLIRDAGPQPETLAEYRSPRSILTVRPPVEGPGTTEFGMLLVQGYRCVNTKQPIIIQQFITYRLVEDGEGPGKVVQDNAGLPSDQARLPGCYEQQLILALPEGVTPGKWFIEAAERDPHTGALRTWFSETFTVVAR